VRWRIEQAEAFREQVEHFSDAERVILADAYQALLRYGPVPDPSSPLVVHRFRDPRAGDAYVLVLPMVVVGYQVLGDTIVVQAADIIRSQELLDSPTRHLVACASPACGQSSASRGWRVSDKLYRPDPALRMGAAQLRRADARAAVSRCGRWSPRTNLLRHSSRCSDRPTPRSHTAVTHAEQSGPRGYLPAW
jgi:hypothetical protein